MPKQDADAAGAIAFFEEKYGDEVRVVQAGNESLELCGGTHVARLGQIGPFEIVSEGSIGSNLRRIFATTGTTTLARLRQAERQIAEAAGLLRARPDELTTAVERKLADLRDAEARLRAAEQAALTARARTLAGEARDGWLVARVDGLPTNQLQELANQVRQLEGLQTVVLGGSPDGSRVALVALAGKGAPLTAPDLLSDAARAVGGGGGGKDPERATAGGKDASRLDEALDEVPVFGLMIPAAGCSGSISGRSGSAWRSPTQARRMATGVTALARSGDRAADHRALADLVADYEAVGIVVGLPISLSGGSRDRPPGPSSTRWPRSGDVVGVEVVTVDERLDDAPGGRRAAGGRVAGSDQRRRVIDQNAAALLLQTWVERRLQGQRGRTG